MGPSRDFISNLTPQCRAFSRALKIKKLKGPMFPGPGRGREYRTDNSYWCISRRKKNVEMKAILGTERSFDRFYSFDFFFVSYCLHMAKNVIMSPQPKVGDILFLVRIPSESALASPSA